MIKIDFDKCILCGICAEECTPVFEFENKKGLEKNLIIKYPHICSSCGHCISICPQNALSHDELPIIDFKPLKPINISSDDMENLIYARRSIRNYKNKPIPKEIIKKLINVAIHAGTSSNGQNEKFIVLQNRDTIIELEKIVMDILWDAGIKYLGKNGLMRKIQTIFLGEKLIEEYTPYHYMIKEHRKHQKTGMIFGNAPLILIMHGLKENYLNHANCSIAMRNVELYALTHGIGSCWVGFLSSAAIRSKKINKFLDISKKREIYGVLMLGYPKYQYKKRIPRKKREVKWI